MWRNNALCDSQLYNLREYMIYIPVIWLMWRSRVSTPYNCYLCEWEIAARKILRLTFSCIIYRTHDDLPSFSKQKNTSSRERRNGRESASGHVEKPPGERCPKITTTRFETDWGSTRWRKKRILKIPHYKDLVGWSCHLHDNIVRLQRSCLTFFVNSVFRRLGISVVAAHHVPRFRPELT